MSEEGSDLSFERAEYESNASSSAMPCSSCSAPLETQYWKWQHELLCGACRKKTESTFQNAHSSASFGKALLLGGLAALGCGIAYAIFVALTDIQLALATIGIAFVVASVIRKASHSVGGRRYQILAVALTYAASTMGYAPAVFSGLKSADAEESASEADTKEDDSVVPPPSVDLSAQRADDRSEKDSRAERTEASNIGFLELMLGVAFLFGVVLSAPFLAITEAPLGFAIVLFGLWEAWKLTQGVSTEIEGPYQVASGSGAETTAQ